MSGHVAQTENMRNKYTSLVGKYKATWSKKKA
jgi:hypothetical protein